MQLNSDHLIRMPVVHSKENYLDGFWRWVALMEAGQYDRAIEALYWPGHLFGFGVKTTWTGLKLEKRVTTFFGGDNPWSVVIPNERLIGTINEACIFEPRRKKNMGWFMAQIPLTTEPDDPKNDNIPLMGLASSFFVRKKGDSLVLSHEIFHI
jgi:hypothetical protein